MTKIQMIIGGRLSGNFMTMSESSLHKNQSANLDLVGIAVRHLRIINDYE